MFAVAASMMRLTVWLRGSRRAWAMKCLQEQHGVRIGNAQQLAEVLFDKLNLQAPRKTRTKNRSTAAEVLEELAVAHELPKKVIEYRELTKMRSTYIDGYRPHADGRVHTTFTFDTATGQLSSRNPNIQNTPKHGRLADAFRAVIRHPTKLVVEWDYKHPVLVHSSGQPMELDVYIESLKLGFEYQGKQHYKPIYWLGGDLLAQRTRDREKKDGCKLVGNIFSIVQYFSTGLH